MIRILVADTQPFLLPALEVFFKDKKELNIVGSAENETELFQVIEAKGPDLLLFDPQVLTEGGLYTISKIQAEYHNLKLLVFTINCELPYIKRILRSGVQGCMYKNVNKEELLKAIEIIGEGGNYYDDYISNTTMQNHYEKSEATSSTLTTREKEVTALIVNSMNTQEIANRLSISRLTVETHRKNIFAKLGINKVTALVHYAIKEGWAD